MENIAAMVEILETQDHLYRLDAASDTSTCLPECLDNFDDWDFEVTTCPEIIELNDIDEIGELQNGSSLKKGVSLLQS